MDDTHGEGRCGINPALASLVDYAAKSASNPPYICITMGNIGLMSQRHREARMNHSKPMVIDKAM